MIDKEMKLSEYIDKLNAEKKPKEHENPTGSPELERLMASVRKVRTLKESSLPDDDFPRKLAYRIASKLLGKSIDRRSKLTWFSSLAGIAAVIVLAFILNFTLPYGKGDLVYAMELAYEKVRAYHGILEIVEGNAQGERNTQARLEVWTDRNGKYFVKSLDGFQEGLITANNGKKKWQIRPDEKHVNIFPAFPDPYRFTLEIGKEIENAKNALETKKIGEDIVAGRKCTILEVSPKGGLPYRIWIDKETKLPLQKQSGMQNSLQYTITYTDIDFFDAIPEQLMKYSVPAGFAETDISPEQLVNSIEEAADAAGFIPKLPESIPQGYIRDSIAVATDIKAVKLYYTSEDGESRIVILQGKSVDSFQPSSTAVLGKIGGAVAEVQSPVKGSSGILADGGLYAGVTDISSIRWQQDGFEYAVVGNASLEELVSFVKVMTTETVEIPSEKTASMDKPQVEVTVDMEIEENEQKSVDGGHSPWKLDPLHVTQVFVSLKIYPEGIQGEYPIDYKDLTITENDGRACVVEISGDNTPIRKVYLKRLVRQDSTGIWTVVGYDPVE